jgi:molybdenum cofactor biosynthesis enzyme
MESEETTLMKIDVNNDGKLSFTFNGDAIFSLEDEDAFFMIMGALTKFNNQLNRIWDMIKDAEKEAGCDECDERDTCEDRKNRNICFTDDDDEEEDTKDEKNSG